MSTTLTKEKVLENAQRGYDDFEKLLATLSPEQLTTAGVNGSWSIKDNIAHLTAWHEYTTARLQAHQSQVQLKHPYQGREFDDVNEEVYQANKDRSLDAVLTDFRIAYQQLIQQVQKLPDDDFNDVQKLWELVAGNTYEHYQEHGDLMRQWLKQE